MSVIRVENASKMFFIHHERHRSFQDMVVNLFRDSGSREKFWALRNVSFEVQRGETVGIIGENGSGKSTLLKLISRIIDPTEGKVTVEGRISPLLELGAGFHPDLTGHENVFLNGSVLGMGRKEMQRKYAEIVEFAELERFIDTPLKHYSSGMYMRLAFAVGINADPDLLIIDEILAVGDEAFQQKCLDRILDLRRRGKTIVFVSHDLASVENICDRAVLLHQGQVVSFGSPKKAIHEYHVILAERENARLATEHERRVNEERAGGRETDVVPPENKVAAPEAIGEGYRMGTREVEIVEVKLLDKTGRERFAFNTGDVLEVSMRYVAKERIEKPVFGVSIQRIDGVQVTSITTRYGDQSPAFVSGEGQVSCQVTIPLLSGSYTLSTAVYDQQMQHTFDLHDGVYQFRVFGDYSENEVDGLVYIPCEWSFEGVRETVGPR